MIICVSEQLIIIELKKKYIFCYKVKTEMIKSKI